MDNSLPGVVEFVSYLGATIDMHVRISPKERVVVQIPNRAGGLAAEGRRTGARRPGRPPTASCLPDVGADIAEA